MSTSNILPATQHQSVRPDLPPMSYIMLEGDWPILDTAEEPSTATMDRIRKAGTGSSITTNLSYLSLGYFFIQTSLLESHATQRDIDWLHVKKLTAAFVANGVHRKEHPGVVIGIGNGWYNMRKNIPRDVLITASSPHRNLLAEKPGGAIGQIICGNHCSAAVKALSQTSKEYDSQDFWYYNVLVPGIG